MKMTSRATAAVAALVCATTMGVAAPAVAAPPPSTAEVINVAVRTGSTTARIAVKYTCTAVSQAPHIWVSVKQNAQRTKDSRLTQEGSGYGQVAAAWSQTHVGNPICDGKSHISTFEVDQREAGYGTLKRGWAYVQFCLFDDYNTQIPVIDMEFGYLL